MKNWVKGELQPIKSWKELLLNFLVYVLWFVYVSFLSSFCKQRNERHFNVNNTYFYFSNLSNTNTTQTQYIGFLLITITLIRYITYSHQRTQYTSSANTPMFVLSVRSNENSCWNFFKLQQSRLRHIQVPIIFLSKKHGTAILCLKSMKD